MGWREFRAWLREMNRASDAEQGRGVSDPDSWEGSQADPFWAEQREKQRQIRGR